MSKKIITEYWAKPGPTREFDWCAYYEGEEERGRYGYGITEQAAKDDLVNEWPEDE